MSEINDPQQLLLPDVSSLQYSPKKLLILGLQQTVYNILLEYLEASKVTIIKEVSSCRARITRTAFAQKKGIARYNGKSLLPHRQIHLGLVQQQLQLQLQLLMLKLILVPQLVLVILVFLNSVKMELVPSLELH